MDPELYVFGGRSNRTPRWISSEGSPEGRSELYPSVVPQQEGVARQVFQEGRYVKTCRKLPRE